MNETRVPVKISSAPLPVGPYSQAVKCDNVLYVSGQLGLDLKTGELVSPDVAEQTRLALTHLQAILDSVEMSLPRVAKTTIFLADMADFPVVNKVYAEFFPVDPPARSTVQVAALPKGARVEIEAIAVGVKHEGTQPPSLGSRF